MEYLKKKQKFLIILALFMCGATISIACFIVPVNGFLVFDPPVTYPPPIILSTPSDSIMSEGDNIQITWTAKSYASQFSRRAYIYVNGIQVKSFSSWTNGQSLSYDFSPNTAGTYSIKCKVTDSYGSDSDTMAAEVENVPQWTVMFYLDGDSDPTVHEGVIFKDGILTNIGSNSEVQLISLKDLSDATSKYCYYGANSVVTCYDQGELNIGAEETLANFIDWSKTNYPAQKYMVVLFDHGMGIMNHHPPNNIGGVCYDNSSDYLTPLEIKNALTGKGIDILGMDACLMGSSEIMYTVRDVVDYYVASENTEPAGVSSDMGIIVIDDDGMSSGWPYETIFPWLKANPTSTAESLASTIVNKYEDSWGRVFNVEYRRFDPEEQGMVNVIVPTTFNITMSAIDTSFMNSIATQFASLTTDLYPNFDSIICNMYDIRIRSENYRLSHYIDLYDFLDEILVEYGLNAYHTKALTLQTTIADAVVNCVYYPNYMAFTHGMSLYFPYITGIFWPEYLNTQWNDITNWGNFLEGFFSTSVFPTISSPSDYYVFSGDPCSITWNVDPRGTGSYQYEISRGLNIIETGYISQASTITYSFTLPYVPVGQVVDYVYKCRIYNSQGYVEDEVIMHVVCL